MGEQLHIVDFCEEKTRVGDGSFAVAFALLQLARAQEATANALHRLGLGNASTHFGAIESLGMQIEKAAEIMGGGLDGLGDIASAIRDHSSD